MSGVLWPSMSHQIDLTANMNDPAATSTWVDAMDAAGRSRVQTFTITRGRGDELTFASAGRSTWDLLNEDAMFDPATVLDNALPPTAASPDATAWGTWAVANNSVSTQAGTAGDGILYAGTSAIKVTTTAAGGGNDVAVSPSSNHPCTPGVSVVAFAYLRAASTLRTVRVDLAFYDGSGTYLGTGSASGTPVTENASRPVQALVTSVAPATTVQVRVIVYVLNTSNGEIHYVSAACLRTIGTGPLWAPPGGTNLLDGQTASTADSEGGGVGGWVAANGNTLTPVSTTTNGAIEGVRNVQLGCIVAGPANIEIASDNAKVPVIAGQTYTGFALVSSWFTQRAFGVSIRWWGPTGAFISETSVAPDVTETAGWNVKYGALVAPAGAVSASLGVAVRNAVNTENHSVDAAGIFPGTVTTWSRPISATPAALTANRALRSRATHGVNLLPTPAVTSAAATGYSATGGTLTGVRAETTAAPWGRTGTGWLVAVTASSTSVVISSPVYLSATPGGLYSGQVWVYVPRTGATAQAVITWQTAGGGANGVSLAGTTLTAGASPVYLNAQVTAVAPASTGRALVTVTVSGTASGDVVLLGASQLESGFLTWTAFDPGNRTYPLWYGYEERGFPTAYVESMTRSVSKVSSIDALAILAEIGISECAVAELFPDLPLAVYPMTDSGGSYIGNVSATRQEPGALGLGPDYVAMGASAKLGSSGIVPAMSGSAWNITVASNTGSILAGFGLPSSISAAGAMTYEFWFQISKNALVALFQANTLGTPSAPGGNPPNSLAVEVLGGSSQITANISDAANNIVGVTGPTVTPNVPHQVVAILAANGKTVTLYYDGALIGTSSSLPGTFSSPAGWTSWLGAPGISSPSSPLASISVALFSSYSGVLSGTRITAHYTAGLNAFSGETVLARKDRLLNYAAWLSAMRTDDAAASSSNTGCLVKGALGLSGSYVLSLLQANMLNVEGTLDVDTQGRVRALTRDYRLLQTGPSYVFGEREDFGELPYEDDPSFLVEKPPEFIYPQVALAQSSGIPLVRSDAAAVLRSGPRTLERTLNLVDPGRMADEGDNLLRTYKDGHTRVTRITLDPSAKPQLWPCVLGIDQGTRVRVRRRPMYGAPALSIDCYVEGVKHEVQAGSWRTTLTLSPAPPWFPWILGDATYGVLGSTTVLI